MMRNEVIHGYLIHSRKYREKSYIVHLYTQEYGRLDGILRQTPPPQYQPIRVQATGKSELKNLTKLEILNQPVFFSGDAYFAGFYLNEILLRLCPLEESMPLSFKQYQITLLQLEHLAEQSDKSQYLKQILRQFEHVLLNELGYAIDFKVDAQDQPIQPMFYYQFQMNEGFVMTKTQGASSFLGEKIALMQNYQQGDDFSHEQLQLLSKLYRQMITMLLGDRSLKSRQLWIQNTRTSS